MESIKSEKSALPTKKEGKQSWSKKITKNKVTEEITVTEAENGFIVCHSKSGEGKDGWFSEEKKYISKENPLDEEEDKSFADDLADIMDEIAESEGMINVN